MKTAFIGHREIFTNDIEERLLKAVEAEIQNGCRSFTMGTHGQFDKLSLWACRQLRKKYEDLDIEVVLTSLHAIDKNGEWDCIPYSDVKTVMYDIEDTHFKRKITLSNQLMIDSCDTLICYVNEKAYRSGAKIALNYAKKCGLKIINLWRDEDQPFFGKTKEQIDSYIKESFSKLKIKK
ncbi:MAG: hypothetical protein J1G01_03820 [Clostridiales bacterium]|nr:hypothetical protein [Clostridiales bacterium]